MPVRGHIKRDIEERIISLSQEYSCVLITGPRQVGKSTVLKQLMSADRTYVTLDDFEEQRLEKRIPRCFCRCMNFLFY